MKASNAVEKIPIHGSKAVIFRNKYDIWQFRMYVKNARRYLKKSLRKKELAHNAHKKDALARVKKLIVENKLTKGDIRGKAINNLI